MTRPLIAISATIEPWPTAQSELNCTRLTTAYTDAVYAVGGQPVILPVVGDPPADLLAKMDGLILSGGGDIDPVLYGEAAEPTVYGIRRDRDDFEAALFHEAVARRIPILAICRGMQLVNILRGGTLLQHISTDPRHWQEAPPATPNHEITVPPGSVLADLVGPGGVAHVNSFHHQALRDLGAGLRVTAMCLDVIEAVEACDADIVAVQWHPEQMAATDQVQRALFDTFVRHAEATRGTAPARN